MLQVFPFTMYFVTSEYIVSKEKTRLPITKKCRDYKTRDLKRRDLKYISINKQLIFHPNPLHHASGMSLRYAVSRGEASAQ